MGLYKRGSIWWTSFTVGRKPFRFSTGEESRSAAETKAAELRLGVERGTAPARRRIVRPASPGAPTFELAVTSYLEHREAQGHDIGNYRFLGPYGKAKGDTARWDRLFAGRHLDSITSEEIEDALREWKERHSWANATRNRALAQIAGLFSYAYGRKWIREHPTEKGRVPRLAEDNARERWLRTEELENLLSKCPDWLAPVVSFAASTGMRLGEVTRLTRADYERDNDGNGFLVVRKTKNRRPLVWFLDPETETMVKALVDRAPFPASPLFPGPRGGSSPMTVRKALQVAAKAAGIEWGRSRTGFTFHSLRHTMASLAANEGVPVAQIQALGNWKTPAMVARYAKYSNDTLRTAAGRIARLVPRPAGFSQPVSQSPAEVEAGSRTAEKGA